MTDDKPPPRQIRLANRLADVCAAATQAGIDHDELLDAIRRRLLGPIERERSRRADIENEETRIP